MRYSFVSAAILALSSSVFAQTAGFDAITNPTQDETVAAGSSLDIIWEPANYTTGTVTITLLEGATPSTLSAGQVIKAGIDNTAGKYTWAIPSDIASFATYGFQISLDSDPTTFQYSWPFHISGTSGGSSSSGTATGTQSTTTMHLGTGTAYTSTSTSSSSTVTAVSNSSVKTTSAAPTPSSNATLLTTLTTAKTSASKTSSSATTATSSSAATKSTNAAVGNVATGGLAMIGGLVLAFAL